MITRTEAPAPGSPPTLVGRLRRTLEALRPVWIFTAGFEGVQRSLIYDLEVAVRILDLPEFAEWLRVHGDDTQSQFGGEIAELIDQAGDASALEEGVADALHSAGYDGDEFVEGIRELHGEAEESRAIRDVLVEVGALAADDKDADIPALLRALLS